MSRGSCFQGSWTSFRGSPPTPGQGRPAERCHHHREPPGREGVASLESWMCWERGQGRLNATTTGPAGSRTW